MLTDGWISQASPADDRSVPELGPETLPLENTSCARPGRGGRSAHQLFWPRRNVEARSGLLVQKQVIAGSVSRRPRNATTVDVRRIVWPNGVLQAEFDRAVDQAVVAEQRLKGSCPWVFA